MAPNISTYGSTNPYATYNFSTTPNASPHADVRQHQPPSDTRPRHTGRLASRFQGITTHPQPPAHASTPAHRQPPAPATVPTHSTPPSVNTQAVSHTPPHSPAHFPTMTSLSSALPHHPHPHPRPQPPNQPSTPPRPSFLIIGLFALRLTKRLVQQLDPYEHHGADLRWLDRFLRPYSPEFALAKLTDPRVIEDYVREYPAVVRRMIKQPRYRGVFMEMNPWKGVVGRELGDEELRSILDFADAAGEWGSVVPLSREYAARMEELGRGRRMAG